MVRSFLLAALFFLAAPAQSATAWNVARSAHFEVYSHQDEATARAALLWLEQLRASVQQQTGLQFDGRRAVRVIGFGSVAEYEPYRLRATADAYYVGAEARDYIVIPTLGSESYGAAAHEYAHLVLHTARLKLPPWLAEGIADLFSTVKLEKRGLEMGGDMPGRMQVLKTRRWMPLDELLALPAQSPVRDTRAGADIFYSESWALAEMLVLSPEYGPGFNALVTALAAGTPSAQAIVDVYRRPLDAVTRDLEAWLKRRSTKALPVPSAAITAEGITTSETPAVAVELMLAEVLLAAGDLEHAESAYRELAREFPNEGNVVAGLAALAAARGKFDEGQRLWTRAVELGLTDAGICFRYASLLDRGGLAAEQLRDPLQRAVNLQPEFDDARYKLALLEANAGEHSAALSNLRAMGTIPPQRAYFYWCAVADALVGLEKGEEAQAAAVKALEFASDATERAHARQISYIAGTHMVVRFARDANGQLQLVTTRAANGPGTWNPFIEPGDDMRKAQGTLREIECSGQTTRFAIDTAAGLIHVTIPDPLHVQMRNAPAEFTCGPQEARTVTVEYAASKAPANGTDGVIRSLEFH